MKTFYAAGVFKIDARSAGYPDLLKIAQEWAKDENFYEIIVRGVSEKNFGIQFVYIANLEEDSNHPIKKYKNELQEKFGDGFYAWDYQHSNDEKSINDIVVLKEFKKA